MVVQISRLHVVQITRSPKYISKQHSHRNCNLEQEWVRQQDTYFGKSALRETSVCKALNLKCLVRRGCGHLTSRWSGRLRAARSGAAQRRVRCHDLSVMSTTRGKPNVLFSIHAGVVPLAKH